MVLECVMLHGIGLQYRAFNLVTLNYIPPSAKPKPRKPPKCGDPLRETLPGTDDAPAAEGAAPSASALWKAVRNSAIACCRGRGAWTRRDGDGRRKAGCPSDGVGHHSAEHCGERLGGQLLGRPPEVDRSSSKGRVQPDPFFKINFVDPLLDQNKSPTRDLEQTSICV